MVKKLSKKCTILIILKSEVQYGYIHVVIKQKFRIFSSYKTETFYLLNHYFSFFQLMITRILLSVLMNLTILMSYIGGITQCLGFCVWLISHRIIFFRFIHVVTCDNNSLFLR